MTYNDINETWNNMTSIKEMTKEQLYERIKYIEQLQDELTTEQWQIDWQSEYDIVCIEMRRRHLSKN